MELTEYEIEILNLMLDGKFDKEEIRSILKSPITGYEYTGAGYFLELSNDILPADRITVSKPTLLGRADEFNVGFVIFIENCKLVLECHSWGIEHPPNTIRKKSIEIIELKQDVLKLKGIYEVEGVNNVRVIEFEAQDKIEDLEVSQITQVIEGKERMNWQSPYDEKYFNSDNKMIGDWIDSPRAMNQGEKLVFFFHELDVKKPIRTQYGDFEIPDISELPDWLTQLTKYEKP